LPISLRKMQDQKSLSLGWHSITEWGRGHVAFPFGYKGSQHCDYI
jgi:hypothetical protein